MPRRAKKINRIETASCEFHLIRYLRQMNREPIKRKPFNMAPVVLIIFLFSFVAIPLIFAFW